MPPCRYERGDLSNNPEVLGLRVMLNMSAQSSEPVAARFRKVFDLHRFAFNARMAAAVSAFVAHVVV